jgi:murein DD-endopeptidase MepM/ murein hydrolase activator NlpD
MGNAKRCASHVQALKVRPYSRYSQEMNRQRSSSTDSVQRATRRSLWLSLILLSLAACEETEQLAQRWVPQTPHEAYLAALNEAGLAETALAQDWTRQAGQALSSPRDISLPFRETVFIAPEQPEALGVRFDLPRGKRVHVTIDVDTDEGTEVFFDMMRLPEDPSELPRPLLTADTLSNGFSYEPYRAGSYVVRVQPELLRGGTFTLTIDDEPALAFPVEDRTITAVLSFFGAERDGGRRSHHGVDIFAPRGTPVLASVPGEVGRVQITELGGKVVWIRDARYNRSLYYAHLDSQAVSNGDWVEPGDTLGFVGNTGNARTTPTHLHYGVYYRGEGPIDPMPFLRPPNRSPSEVTADANALGRWVRPKNEGVRLRQNASSRADIVAEVAATERLRVWGANGDWLRVRSASGVDGYIAGRLTVIDDLAPDETLRQTPTSRISSPETP